MKYLRVCAKQATIQAVIDCIDKTPSIFWHFEGDYYTVVFCLEEEYGYYWAILLQQFLFGVTWTLSVPEPSPFERLCGNDRVLLFGR